MLVPLALPNVRPVGHENDDARLDAVFEEPLIDFLVLLQRLAQLLAIERAKLVERQAQVLDRKNRVAQALLPLSRLHLLAVQLLEAHRHVVALPDLFLLQDIVKGL